MLISPNQLFARFLEIWGRTVSRNGLQRWFSWEQLLVLRGMNFGGGDSPQASGERNAASYVLRALRREPLPVIFDVGANTGQYAAMILALLNGRPAVLHSFEPSYVTFETAKKNLEGKPVQLHRIGFGDNNTKSTLYYDAEGAGLASVFKKRLDHFGIDVSKSEEIELKTIDQFCRDNKIDHIDFLKLDVEGFELNVLKGAKEMIERGDVRFIQFEFGSSNIASRTFFQDFFYLLKDKYSIYRILKSSLYPVSYYTEAHEVFMTTNYLAEKK